MGKEKGAHTSCHLVSCTRTLDRLRKKRIDERKDEGRIAPDGVHKGGK